MTKKELEKEAEEKTVQYMSEHTEKYNCENTKLETDNYNTGREYGFEDGYLAAAEPREKRIAELETTNKRISDEYHRLVGSLEKKQNEIVELIKDYMIVVKGGNITVCSVPEENRCINVLKLNEQAEQFLKDNGCSDCLCEDCNKD